MSDPQISLELFVCAVAQRRSLEQLTSAQRLFSSAQQSLAAIGLCEDATPEADAQVLV